MGEAVRVAPAWSALLLLLLAAPRIVFAHRLDEYLQATLVQIEPDRVRLQINLTPGVAVAEKVLAHIDLNKDGLISTNEAAAYGELLMHDLSVRLDRHKAELKVMRAEFPEPGELRTGWGIIRMEYSASIGAFGAGTHKITMENKHLRHLSVFLLNAAQPGSTEVLITAQRRNKNQSKGEIEFLIQPLRNASTGK